MRKSSPAGVGQRARSMSCSPRRCMRRTAAAAAYCTAIARATFAAAIITASWNVPAARIVSPSVLMRTTPWTTTKERTMAEARDKLLAFLRAHQQTCPQGQRCREDCNVIAFLCHALGIRGERLLQVNELVLDYDRRCPGCSSCAAH